MSDQSVPLLASDGMNEPVTPSTPGYSVVSETPSQTPASRVPERYPDAPTPSTIVSDVPLSRHEPQQQNIIVAQNETVIQYKPIEGYLAICGGCSSKILFPLGRTRVDCSKCHAINYLSPQSIPQVPKKALLICPKCNANILYTIGCTHFQCTCGCVIEIPIPDYYIPFVSKNM